MIIRLCISQIINTLMQERFVFTYLTNSSSVCFKMFLLLGCDIISNNLMSIKDNIFHIKILQIK